MTHGSDGSDVPSSVVDGALAMASSCRPGAGARTSIMASSAGRWVRASLPAS